MALLFLTFFFLISLFIYFCCVPAFSSCSKQGSCYPPAAVRASLVAQRLKRPPAMREARARSLSFGARPTPCGGFSCLQSAGSRAPRFQQRGLSGSRAQAQWLWGTDLVAPWHVESSQTRDEPMSLALAGRFLATGPLAKSLSWF